MMQSSPSAHMAATIAAAVTARTGTPFRTETMHAMAGGSRWRTWRVDNANGALPAAVFVKWGRAEDAAVFAAEVDGLQALREGSTFRIPSVLAQGGTDSDDGAAWLILEWIDLAPLDAATAGYAGEALAAQHRRIGEVFGWPRDNFIGATPQYNAPMADWIAFYQHRRLHAQLRLAARNRLPGRMIDRGERLAADLGAFFRDYRPVASLLHGDTWVGNLARDAEGQPVAYDPAVYHGDREADLAMAECFGGYPAAFFAAYRNAWPLDVGYAVRKHLYQLYHLLNHANLFAGDYVSRAAGTIDALLAEIR